MRKRIAVSLVLWAIALLVPFAVIRGGDEPYEPALAASVPLEAATPPPATATPSPSPSASPAATPAPPTDAGRIVRLYRGGETTELALADYLRGVVGAEMPGGYPAEALRAQAVAARTYMLYKSRAAASPAHPDADVCADYGHCTAYLDDEELRMKWGGDFDAYYKNVTDAVEATAGLVMIYDNEPVLAVFHAISSGNTESAADVWGEDYPYLRGVASPGEEAADGYAGTVTMTAAEFKKRFLERYPEADFDIPCGMWFADSKRSDSGGIIDVKVGGVRVTGSEVRAIYGLRSTNFTVACDEDSVAITTKGYGHGVGLSQNGARAMAEKGGSFRDILAWYYSGVSVVAMDD